MNISNQEEHRSITFKMSIGDGRCRNEHWSKWLENSCFQGNEGKTPVFKAKRNKNSCFQANKGKTLVCKGTREQTLVFKVKRKKSGFQGNSGKKLLFLENLRFPLPTQKFSLGLKLGIVMGGKVVL